MHGHNSLFSFYLNLGPLHKYILFLHCVLFFSPAVIAHDDLGELDAIDSILLNPTLNEVQKVKEVLISAKKHVSSYEKGSVQLKKTLALAEKNDLFEEKFRLLNSIVRFAVYMQEFDTIYYYCNKNIDFLKDNNRSELIGEPLGYMMSGFYYQDRYQEAIDHFNENKKYFEAFENIPYQSTAYYGASINYEQLDEVDSTLFYMEKAISVTDPEDYFDEYLNLTAVLLAMYSEYDRKADADVLVDEILKEKANLKDTINQLSINNSLGQHFQFTNDYESALKYFNAAVDISLAKGFITETATTYFHIYQIEKAQGNFKDALETLEKYNAIQDSINSLEIKIATQEFEEKYQNDKLTIENLEKAATIKEEENNRILAENETSETRNSLYVVLMVLLLIVLIATFWIVTVINRKKKAALQAKLVKEEIERDLAENQLKALRSQMNPHFVFNAINSIQELILKEETAQSYNSLITFSQLVRNTLEYSKKEFISLDAEIEYLALYLTLEKLRFEDDFSYEIKNKADVECLVPSIVLQPFVENALKHGLFHKTGAKKLSITFYETDHLICEIKDNGIGREQAQEITKRRGKNYESFSTNAIAKRMEILSEKHGSNVYYETEDLKDENQISTGTKVMIHLPNVL